MNRTQQAEQLTKLLSLASPPIAVAFSDEQPAGVTRIATSQPAGCGYWRLAGQGQVFATLAEDHMGCPVGAHTHHVELPPAKAEELQALVGTMVELEYIDPAEVATLPRREAAFRCATYGPLATSPVCPSVVLVRGKPLQIMKLQEAAKAAGVQHDGAALGRPACSVIPATENSDLAVTSLGCIGNRVYTELGDDELYLSLPGHRVAEVLVKLATIVQANEALATFHAERARS
jgi:uncharacterized protein (DUF169 family)